MVECYSNCYASRILPGFHGAGTLRSGRFVHLGCGPHKIVKPNDGVHMSNFSVPFLPGADVRDSIVWH